MLIAPVPAVIAVVAILAVIVVAVARLWDEAAGGESKQPEKQGAIQNTS